MADFRSLTLQSGTYKQQQDADSLIIGAGIKTASGDLTITPAGTNAIIPTGKVLQGAGTAAFDFSGASGTFQTSTGAVSLRGDVTITGSKTLTTGTGTVTVNGATVFAAVAVTASGAASFDLSGGSGVFKTSTGAVTIGPGAVTVSGASTFSAAGTALAVTNNATVGGTLIVTGVLSANGGVERSTSGTMSIGTTSNTTALTIGRSGVTTTNAGDLTVTGNLTVNGTTTSVNSTVVDIVDRVIHVNHSTGTVAVPSAITGLSVHRGNTGAADRDHASIVWVEGSSRWNFCLVTGGDDSTVGADQAVKMGALTATAGATVTGGVITLTANAASTWSTSSGALTITSAAAATWSTAAGALSLDGNGGLNLQTAAATRIAITNSAATIQAGVTLATTGTGNINLPQNASARFQIEGVSTGATVTAANLNTLTNGSNADALHTHATGTSTSVSITGTAGETLLAFGAAVFDDASGTAKVFKADANGAGELVNVVGFSSTAATVDTSVDVVVSGEISTPDAVWDSVPAVTDVGKKAFLSETAGKITLTAPSTSGSTVIKVGIVTRGGTGAVKLAIQIGDGVVL